MNIFDSGRKIENDIKVGIGENVQLAFYYDKECYLILQ